MVVFSRALAALQPSLIAFLIVNAQALSGGLVSPISLCNILFVGNLCAAITVVAWFGAGGILDDLRGMPRRTLLGLAMNGCLAALLSSLIFIGLEYTMVTNAVLLGRLGPVIFALAGTVIFGKVISRQEWIGFSFIIAGILLIVLFANNLAINRGDLFIIASAFVYAATSVIGKLMLTTAEIPLRTVVFSRNAVSSIVFFIFASILFGPEHFAEAFSGSLWVVMAIYALIVIVLAQFFWYAALGQLDARVIGRWTSITPVFGVLYAFLLNGERPSGLQLMSFAVIMVGIAITIRRPQPARSRAENLEAVAEIAVRGESAASLS